MNKEKKIKITCYFLSSIILFSYICGFYFGENSAGAGGYTGDLTWILKNIDIFKNNNLFDAIFHKDLFGNRTPLLYVINNFVNPFFFDVDKFRISLFIFSFLGPLFLYLCLSLKFKNISKPIIFLLSLSILLSPFYRTTAFWGLNENYGIISVLISIFFFNLFISNKFIEHKKNIIFFLLITFSSLTIYFDQKLVIVTIFIFVSILNLKNNYSYKFAALILYFIYSLPFIYLITEWKGIVPTATQIANPNTITNISNMKNLYFPHLGYAVTMIAFYVLPFLFFKKKSLLFLFKDFFQKKISFVIISLPIIYILSLYLFYDFTSYTMQDYWIGLGFVHKLSILIFDNFVFQELFTYICFFASAIILAIYLENNLKDFLIISFFLILSLLLWPLMQEYFDPIILIFALIIFNTKPIIKFENSLFLIFYLSFFLVVANLYYYIIL